MAPESGSRPYRKRKRAEQEEQTRRRITEAAVELHGTVGPARTSVTDLAKRAGVSRMTVYSHFPTERDVFEACSSHWATKNPGPDPTRWSSIGEPHDRLRTALEELYGWYDGQRAMLGNVLRDVSAMPELGEVMEEMWTPLMARYVDALAEGWPTEEVDEENLRVTLRVVVDFDCWRILSENGMDTAAAAAVAARMAAVGAGSAAGLAAAPAAD